MPVAGRDVITYTYKVGRCYPEHERARDGTVSDLMKSIQLGGGFFPRKFDLPSRLCSVCCNADMLFGMSDCVTIPVIWNCPLRRWKFPDYSACRLITSEFLL